MGTMELVLLTGGIMVVAVILLVLVDKRRGPICCAICRQPIQGFFAVRRIGGRRQRVCSACDGR
jgi:hypothetical protein